MVFFCSQFWFFFVFAPCSLQYNLTVVASDALNESECTVVVYLRDLNDLAPVFNQESYLANITEETVFRNRPLLQVVPRRGTRWWRKLHFATCTFFF